MRPAFIACVLSSVASSLAYQVIRPNPSQGWTNSGAQPLSWQWVETDALNFTAVLVNNDLSIMPEGPQVLAALIRREDDETTLNPPAGGWPLGGGFRVNLVKDEASLNTIYAQSNEFNITTSTSGSGSVSAPRPTATPTNTRSNTGSNNTPSPNNSGSAPEESAPAGNGALSTYAGAGIVTLVAGAVSLLL